MAKYVAIALNDGLAEIQRLAIIFDKCSKIIAKPAVGADYWNPNTKKASKLTGAISYEPITLESLLSKEQYETSFLTWLDEDTTFDGSLTATHEIGKIRTTLQSVRYFGHEYGEIDKLSNDAAKLILTVTFEGIKPNIRASQNEPAEQEQIPTEDV